MSLPLSASEEDNYKNIIDGILATADLETVTRKRIRSGLETAVGKNLGPQKEAIKKLIDERFDAITSAPPGAMPTPPSLPMPLLPNVARPSPKRDRDEMTNGRSNHIKDEEEEEEEDEDEEEIQVTLPKKKQKRESPQEDEDAKLAAQLQAQENQLARARTTRGGGSAKVAKPKGKKAAKPKKKSKAKVVDEDSDAEGGGSGGEKAEKRKAGGGFQKPFSLSYQLADLCGESVLPRPQVVKKLWEHIKANELQDPKDKRQIICDEKMRAVFKTNKIDMFQMNKHIGGHLYPVEEQPVVEE